MLNIKPIWPIENILSINVSELRIIEKKIQTSCTGVQEVFFGKAKFLQKEQTGQ